MANTPSPRPPGGPAPLHCSLHALALAALAACGGHAFAQTTILDTVTVTGRSAATANVAGFGDVPLSKSPFQASVVSGEQMRDRDITRLADVTRVDPSVSDAYNTEGYWDYLTIRGFIVDNRFNYRRDGLPINAETSIPLDNKLRIEVLRGTSGMQAGTSAPGGLVNVVVKRPALAPVRQAWLDWLQPGSVRAAVDVSQRFGEADAFGLRVNAAAEHRDPAVRNARGKRTLVAVAGDWRLGPDSLFEAEFESSHRSQPSVPGFSLLGATVPAPADSRANLNNQPWSLPVVLDGNTATLRYTRKFGSEWQFSAHAATQLLESQDRIAFPFGCFDPAPPPEGTYYPDRYCPNGNFDLYDFRSESEHRRSDVLELAASGKGAFAGVGHVWSAGLLQTRVRNRFRPQAYNYVGTGNISGTLVTPANPEALDQNTQRSERSSELFFRDALRFSDTLTGWLGLRHTRLARESVRTDGSRATAYAQGFTTPWLAASWAFNPDTFVYASWGKGTESDVVPNRARYANRSEAVSAPSRQSELGVKYSSDTVGAGIAYFDISRRAYADIGLQPGGCDSDRLGATCLRTADGWQRHRGIEAEASLRDGPWSWQGGVQWLHARREGSANAAINGKRPTNVPARTLKLSGRRDFAAVPGLSVSANIVANSDRMVLEDNSIRVPGYTTLGLNLRYATLALGKDFIWRAGIGNALNRNAWREAPLQFSHTYFLPLEPRSVSVSMEAAF